MTQTVYGPVPGQERALAMVSRARQRNRLGHALLIVGPNGVGKIALALEIARQRHCTSPGENACQECAICRRITLLGHPDVFVATPLARKDSDQGEILERLRKDLYAPVDGGGSAKVFIGQIRDLNRWANMQAFEGHKTAIVCNADHLRDDAANALLKTLEEPPDDTLILLTAEKPHALLPTIRSRGQIVQCSPLSSEAVATILRARGFAETEATSLAQVAAGSVHQALTAAGDQGSDGGIDPRENGLAMLNLGLSGPPHLIVEKAENVGRSSSSEELDRMLAWMLLWLRDVWSVHCQSADSLANADRVEDVYKLSEKIDIPLATYMAEKVETVQEILSRNVSPAAAISDLILSEYSSARRGVPIAER